jgi:indolepyruvate decarboxylase
MMTDLNTGGFSFNIHHNSVVKAMHSSVQIRQAVYANVPLGAFLDELIERVEKSWDLKDLDVQRALDHAFHRPTLPWKPIPQAALTMKRFFDKMAHFIPKNAIVIGETGNALFGCVAVAFFFIAQYLTHRV